jgi:hypothetical protein
VAKFNVEVKSNKGLDVTFANSASQNITMKASQLTGTLNSLADVNTGAKTQYTGDALIYNAGTQKYEPKSGVPFQNSNNQLGITHTMVPYGTDIDIGTPDKPFRSLYVTPDTIVIGNIAISDTGGQQLLIADNRTGNRIGQLGIQTADGRMIVDGGVSIPNAEGVLEDVATTQYVNARISGEANALNVGVFAGTLESQNNTPLADGLIGGNTIIAQTSVLTVLDLFNEAMNNIRKDVYVRTVDFTSDITAGGVGSTATLTLTVDGTANEYDVNWGDGAYTNNTTDTTPSHTYNTTVGTPFDVTVTARNTGAYGQGSNTSFTRTDYITIYTADPTPDFDIYNALTGGSEVTEANTNQAVYIENTTTNVANDATTATFSINWGDGSSIEGIDSKVDAGGPQGDRLSHTYTSGTGTGTHTLTFAINSHSTATPGLLPLSTTKTLKIFNLGIAAPNDLTTKTIAWATSTVGSSPKLASGFTENSTGKSAGDSISSSFPRFTSGTIGSTAMGTFFHTTGSVTQQINDTTTGSPTVDSQNVDFYNYDASGSGVSAGSRIYAPGLYETGTKARISYSVTSGSTGVNKAELSTTEGNSNELYYVYDSMTSSPTVDVSGASVTEGTANYRYISGIPFYDDNSTLTIGGVTVTNISGQTYYGASNPYTIGATTADPIDGSEDDQTGSIFTATNFDHQDVIPAGSRSGNIPNVGLTSAVTLENRTVTVNSSARRVGRFAYTARNVNGSDTADITSPYILVHSTAPLFDETAIAVEDALGAGYTTDATRLTGFTGATPSFSGTTDYYVDNAWSGAETVAGTDEAIFWLGTLKHFDDDLSTGYLPVGPDLATGRSGTQYVRFAFKRSAVSNIRVRLTGKVSGFFYAAPGTDIDDASTINGWVDASVQYNGSGYPGADTGNGGNGSNGGAFTGADRIVDGTTYSNQTFDLTLGTVSTTDSYNNQVLISIALNSDDYITALSFEDTD